MSSARTLLGAEGLKPVSPSLIPARYVASIIPKLIWVALAVGCVVLGLVQGWWWMYPLALIPLAFMLPSLILTPRRVRALGYLDRDEDLVTASGIMFRSVEVVPYGRIQEVTVSEGPIERRFGIATLSFSTASSSGAIPGLPREEAERLRELLTARGIERMQSL